MNLKYFKELASLIAVTEGKDGNGKKLSLESAINATVNLIKTIDHKKNKLIFIGNGGSASIASHLAVDFLKNAKISAITFNDASLITCISNDLGYEFVFEKPIDMLARKGDLLFAISSSGRSRNILNAVKKAKTKGCFVVTFSGFKQDNPLRSEGCINFYLPSSSYGYVEVSHLALCHCIVDEIVADRTING